jgi:hypothetical protein
MVCGGVEKSSSPPTRWIWLVSSTMRRWDRKAEGQFPQSS